MATNNYSFLYVKRWCALAFFFFIMLATPDTSAQDIHFSQFYLAPLTQNPAMAGALYDLQGIVNYKDQWQSVTSPYRTVAVSFDMRLNSKKRRKGFWAAGINIFNDKAGDAGMGITQANLTAAYHVHLNEYNTLGAGLQGGFAQHTISPGALQWGNQYDGTSYNGSLSSGEPLPAGSGSFTYLDAGAGLVWTYNNTSGSRNVTDNHDLKFNLGVSVFHVNQPNYSFYNDGEKLYMKAVVHGDALISIPGTSLGVVPGFMFYRQGNVQEIYAGTMVRLKMKQESKFTGFEKGAAISMGGYYRAGDGLAAAMLLEYANYAIGFSYDFNTSPLKTASMVRGGVEVTLRFVTPNPFLKRGGSSILYQPTP
jgi:type IX secretion system PorP/SprF family membrane protein